MAVNSKSKGNTFERTIANYLSDRFKDYTGKEKSFIRNIDSGSYFGGSNQKRINTHTEELQKFGDVLTPDQFRWTIECKAYKTPPSLGSILKGEYKKFDEWLDQAAQDAVNSNKQPLLIVKFNNTETFVMVTDCLISIMKFKYKDYYAYKLDDFFQYDEDEWYYATVLDINIISEHD